MKSGEFAHLCGTTKNTLIHYDDIGLLHPAEKGANRYRNYSMADFARFSVIRAMTQAGFSLAQVRAMLDTPDPERLAALADENTSALKRRMAELRRSERLLAEIGRQAAAAQEASPQPAVRVFPERVVLVAEDVSGLKIDGNWEGVLAKDATVVEGLAKLGVEAAIAPYGVTAQVGADGLPSYQEFFYLLPKKPQRAPFGTARTLPARECACIGYVGPWKEVGNAYQQLAAFLKREGLRTEGPWYEISQTRLLDTDEAHYRCTLSVAVR